MLMHAPQGSQGRVSHVLIRAQQLQKEPKKVPEKAPTSSSSSPGPTGPSPPLAGGGGFSALAGLLVEEAIDAAIDIGRHLGRGIREKPTSGLLDRKLEKGGMLMSKRRPSLPWSIFQLLCTLRAASTTFQGPRVEGGF